MRSLLAALTLLSAPGCSPPDSTPAHLASAVLGGEPAPDPADDAIVALGPRRLLCPATLEARCTGVLVAPALVLTAAHCVEEARPGDLEIAFGSDVAAPTHVEAVTAIVIHPDRALDPGRSDLALVRLRRAVAEAPLPLAVTPVAPGQRLRAVGFGRTAASGPTGRRVAGPVVVTAVEQGVVSYGPDPAMTCGGDSGGPLLDAAGAVVGVTRSGDDACQQVGRALAIALATGLLDREQATPAPATGGPPLAACGVDCAADVDCPVEARCLRQGASRRCGYLGLPAGAPVEGCTADADCAGGSEEEAAPCVAVGSGAEQRCRCWRPCAPASAGSAGAASTGRPADAVELAGGACASDPASGAAGWPGAALVVVAAIGAGRAGRRAGAGRPGG